MKKHFSLIFKSFAFTMIIIGCYAYASPYISILNFKNAIEEGDSSEASKYINFQSLRESLAKQIEANMVERINKQVKSYPMNAISLILVKPVVEGIVNTTISTEGLNLLINNASISKPIHKSTIQSNQKSSKQTDISLYYQGVNRFILSSKYGHDKPPIVSIWERKGAFHWELNNIQIPLDIISNI